MFTIGLLTLSVGILPQDVYDTSKSYRSQEELCSWKITRSLSRSSVKSPLTPEKKKIKLGSATDSCANFSNLPKQ